MKDFKRASRLLWYKNRLPIALMGMFLLLSFVLGANASQYRLQSRIVSNYRDLAIFINGEEWRKQYPELEYDFRDDKINYGAFIEKEGVDNIIKNSKEYTKKIAEEFNIDLDRIKQDPEVDDYYEEYFEGIDYDKENRKVDAFYTVQNAVGYLDLDNDDFKIDISSYVFELNIFIQAFSLLLAMFYNGFENITPYYEFSKMAPWSREMTYTTKAINGVIIILLFSILGTAIPYIYLKSGEYFSDYYVIRDYLRYGLSYYITPLTVFLITLSVGELAGSFLGSIGLFSIAVSGLWLTEFNLMVPSEILGLDNLENSISNFGENLRNIRIVDVLLYPSLGVFSLHESRSLAFGLVGILFFILGYLFIKIAKSERNGLFVLHTVISKIVEIIAIITTTNFMAAIFQSLIEFNSVINLVMYVVLLFINVIFWRRMFKVRIGI